MSDERIQELRRRVALGEVGARAELLAARLRKGELRRERLEVAAHAGDDDARCAVGLADAMPARLGQPRLGREACARAAIALARAALAAGARDARAHECLAAAERALRAGRSARQAMAEWMNISGGAGTPSRIIAGLLAAIVFRFECERDGLAPKDVARPDDPDLPVLLRVAGQVAGEATVRAALRQELGAWALGD